MQSYSAAAEHTAMQPRRSGVVKKIAGMASLVALGAAGVAVSIYITPGRANLGKEAAPVKVVQPVAPQPDVPWVAAAPGRVEPRTGLVRISAGMLGRVTDSFVRVNDRVAEGEVLIRLDDVEARTRLAAADAEASARKRERDAQPGTAGREDVRKAEDAVFAAERAVMNARFELDDAIAADRKGTGAAPLQAQARKRLNDARERLRQQQAAFALAQAKGNIPGPNRLEAGVSAAYADVTMAESMLDKTRMRSPMAGTVLQLHAKTGEMVTPAPEQPLIVIGDMSVVRVRAEVDEHDVSKIKIGQKAFVRSNGYPGQDFEGRVTELAPSLAAPRMSSRGARRATDVEVMEVMIDLEGTVPLLPGMRAEAYFRR
jgi:HlyD family secretion protein